MLVCVSGKGHDISTNNGSVWIESFVFHVQVFRDSQEIYDDRVLSNSKAPSMFFSQLDSESCYPSFNHHRRRLFRMLCQRSQLCETTALLYMITQKHASIVSLKLLLARMQSQTRFQWINQRMQLPRTTIQFGFPCFQRECDFDSLICIYPLLYQLVKTD